MPYEDNQKVCGKPNPDEPWRTCVSCDNHKGEHYTPPVYETYKYWGN